MTVVHRTAFEPIYAGQPRWEIGRPQQVFLNVAYQIAGSILDSGCGTGDNAFYLWNSVSSIYFTHHDVE